MRKQLTLLAVFILLSSSALALSTIYVPAVGSNGEGLLTTVTAEAVPGTGEIDISLHSFFSVETQQSLRDAVGAAAALSGKDASKYDFRYRINTDAEVIDGPSGGAAFALLAYAEFAHKKLRSDTAVTGAIKKDGSFGKIGGVVKKAEAAGNNSIKLFIMPLGQQEQENVDIASSAQERWGMQAVEARNLSEAVTYAFSPQGSTVEEPTRIVTPLVLAKAPSFEGDLPLKQIAEKSVSDAEKQALALPESSIIRKSVLESVNTSRYLLAQGYYYSAANAAFLAQITLAVDANANITPERATELINRLDNKSSAQPVPNKTLENLEWSVAAELRQYWALARLDDADADMNSSNAVAQDLAVANQWLDAADEMIAIADSFGGEPLDELAFRDTAKKLVARAENYSELDTEAAFHFKRAKAELEDGAYAAAAYDASFAYAFGQAIALYADKTTGEASKALLNASNTDKFKTAWAKYYFIHAQYNYQEWLRTGDSDNLLNALKLQHLAVQLDSANEMLLNATQTLTTPAEASAAPANMTIKITPTPSSGFLNRDTVLLILGVLALAVVALLVVVARSPRNALNPHEARAKLDKLDELLIDGKISESNYDRLRQKYSPYSQSTTQKRATKQAKLVRKQKK